MSNSTICIYVYVVGILKIDTKSNLGREVMPIFNEFSLTSFFNKFIFYTDSNSSVLSEEIALLFIFICYLKNMPHKKHNLSGFTLIEVLIVIGLIAILAAVTIIAINPAQNFIDARDAERQAEVTQIASAINQWAIATDSIPGTAITQADGSTTAMATCAATLAVATSHNITPAASADALDEVDLETLLVDTYIPSIPTDPSSTAADEGYQICANGNRVTIWAPSAEGGSTISANT